MIKTPKSRNLLALEQASIHSAFLPYYPGPTPMEVTDIMAESTKRTRKRSFNQLLAFQGFPQSCKVWSIWILIKPSIFFIPNSMLSPNGEGNDWALSFTGGHWISRKARWWPGVP
jgi:hypothetical protein